jgi:hypothetical protein
MMHLISHLHTKMNKLAAQITLTTISLLSTSALISLPPLQQDQEDALPQLYPTGFTAYVCAILLLAFGLPHGALDHILYHLALKKKSELQGSTGLRNELISSTFFSKSSHSRPDHCMQASCIHSFTFYINYLGMMTCWGVSWVLWPLTSFWSFLAVSAWHFGEGDLGDLEVSDHFKPLLFLSRGCLIIGMTMTIQPKVTLPIIQHLINMPQDFFYSLSEVVPLSVCVFHFTTLWRLWCLVLIQQDGPDFATTKAESKEISHKNNCVVFPATKKPLTTTNLAIETAKSVLFVCLFVFLNPLVAFSIYFGCWHGLGCIFDFIEWLKTNEWAGFHAHNIRKEKREEASLITLSDLLYFYQLAAPYTLVSLFGMQFLYLLATWMDTAAFSIMNGLDIFMVWAVFIGCISVLTGGHVWVLLGMYWPLAWDADPLGVE